MTVPPFTSPAGRALHRLAALLVLCGIAGTAYALGTLNSPAPWPFDVKERRLLTDEIQPGGYLLVRRIVDYHEDCDIRIARRVQSSLPSGRRVVPEPVYLPSPPWERSGKPQQAAIQIPEHFPCGPAYLVESVSVGCTWWERLFEQARRKKPDIIWPFFVVGCS